MRQEYTKYLEDYILHLGELFLPNEDYSIEVVHDKDLEEFKETKVKGVHTNGDLDTNAMGITLFTATKSAYEKFGNKVGCVYIFLDHIINLKDTLYQDVPNCNLLTRIRLSTIHECRHAQQHAYIAEKNDYDISKTIEMIKKDTIISSYDDQILELDAQVYAYGKTFNEFADVDTWKDMQYICDLDLDIVYKRLMRRIENRMINNFLELLP